MAPAVAHLLQEGAGGKALELSFCSGGACPVSLHQSGTGLMCSHPWDGAPSLLTD